MRGPRQNSGSIGQRWKRREALASRLVLMGRHHTNPPNPPNRTAPQQRPARRGQGRGALTRKNEDAATTIRTTTNPPPTPPAAQQRRRPAGGPATQRANKRGGRTTQSCGGHSTGETPSNIPNLEAKPGRANGTAPQGVWESRKPPQHTTPGGPRTQARPPPTHTHTTTRAHAHAREPTREHTRAREEYRTHARNTTRQNQPSSTRRLVWT